MSPEIYKIIYWERGCPEEYHWIVDDNNNLPRMGYPTFEAARSRVQALRDPDYEHAIVILHADDVRGYLGRAELAVVAEFCYRTD